MGSNDNIASIPFDTEAILRLKERKQRKRKGRFVKGPLSWPWVTAAAHCHPRALEILLAVKMLSDTSGQKEVALSTEIIDGLGISVGTKSRAVAALEKAKFILVKRQRGRLLRVSLL